MSCGVPLISTTGGSLPEVVGDAGILVPTGNSKAIADAIEKLLKDEKLRAELSKKGRERILEKFSWKRAAQQMTAYYLKVIEENNSRTK